MMWIDVREHVPATDTPVIVAYKASYRHTTKKHHRWSIFFACYSGGQWRFIDKRHKTHVPENVRYWMPRLPLPEDVK